MYTVWWVYLFAQCSIIIYVYSIVCIYNMSVHCSMYTNTCSMNIYVCIQYIVYVYVQYSTYTYVTIWYVYIYIYVCVQCRINIFIYTLHYVLYSVQQVLGHMVRTDISRPREQLALPSFSEIDWDLEDNDGN